MSHKNHFIYLSGFLDFLSVSMVMPMISTHLRDMGSSSTIIGLVGSIYGGVQLISSPLVGKWSDSSGRVYSVLLCMVLTSAGYMTLAFATTLYVVVVARFINGLFKHSQNLTKSLLADVTDKDHQSSVMGNFNAASSFGFIVGPLIGGHIAETSQGFQKVAAISAIIFLLNSAIVYMYVEEPLTKNSSHDLQKTDSSTSMKKLTSEEIDFSPKLFFTTFHSISWTDMWDLFLIKFCLGFSTIIFRSNFSLVMRETFHASPKTIGYMTSYTGCVSAFFGLFVGYISNFYKDDAKLFLHMSIFQVFTLFMLSYIESFWIYILFLTPLSFITTVSRVASTSLTIQRGCKKDIGTLMGFSQSVMSIARMLAPFVSGLVLDINRSGPSIIGTFVSLVAVVVMIVRPQSHQQPKAKSE